jgi:outer membrane receptor protein involved in Fe transport
MSTSFGIRGGFSNAQGVETAPCARFKWGVSMKKSRWGARSFTEPLISAASRLRLGQMAAAPVLLAVLAAAPGFAQTAEQTAQAGTQTAQATGTEAIEVTGTRIRAPNVVAIAPVLAVTEEEVKLEGTSNVEDLLNRLPQVIAGQNKGVDNGATGTATVDLRGLGANRTLVLIDGKRLGPGDASAGTAADLNFIPAPLVQSIEVLTGGASTDYGSDALSGVVNFKMKRDFEGIEFDQQVNGFQHDQQNNVAQGILSKGLDLNGTPIGSPGDQFGGVDRTSTIIVGANGANGKSNITLYLTDAHTDPILQGSRDFSECAIDSSFLLNLTNNQELVCGGSSNSPQGRFAANVNPATGASGLAVGHTFTTNPNGTASFVPGVVDFNTDPLNLLQREDQRYTAGGFAHDEIAPWLDIYADFGFLDDKTTEQIAPGGLFTAGGPTGTAQLNCNNPFLGAQQAQLFGCGVPKLVNAQNQVTILLPGLRFAGIPRTDSFEHTDYRFVVGARGDLPYGFDYDVSVAYWQTNFSNLSGGFASFTKIQDALLVGTNAAGQPVCLSGNAGCVPLNIFSRNGALAAESSVLTSSEEVGTETEVVAGANISGDLGQFGITSPLAKNPVSTVVGFEYRFENDVTHPDQTLQSGDLVGGAGDIPPVDGSFDDMDFYGELHVPVIEDLPFAKAVDLDLGLRHSGYAIYGTDQTFDTNTWKFQGDWQIVDDVKLRGGYNRAVRAPNIFELFDAPAVRIAGNGDPCSGSKPTATLAACERTGVTPAQFGNISNCIDGQCSALTEGNTTLQPEKADTYTWGLVYTPTYLKNFNFSMDYFTIDIADAIGTIPFTTSLNSCIAGPSPLCANIRRGPGGILFGQAGFITEQTINTGSESTSGIDFAASYKHDLDFLDAGDLGSIVLNFNGTWTAALQTTPLSGGGSFDCAGLFGETCGSPTPQWRHQVRATWVTPWDANLSVDWRHLSSVGFDGNSSNPILNQGFFDTVTQNISSFDYFDLSGTWQIAHNIQLRAGVNNIFDRDPPIVDSLVAGGSNGNTYPGTYDVLGREIFAGINVKF